MSKLRIIGGALIVLFLFTIVALGIIALRQASLRQDLDNTATDVANLKTATSAVQTGTVVPTANATDTTPTTSTGTVTVNTDTTKTYTNETIAIKLSAPESWSCSNSADFEGQSYISCTKENISFSVGTPAAGFICNENCVSFIAHQTENSQLTYSWKSGELANIMGLVVAGKYDPNIPHAVQQVTVRAMSGSLDNALKYKSEIYSIMDSISTL